MKKWSGLMVMLCLIVGDAPATADSSPPAAGKHKPPSVSPALVAADAARHRVNVRFSGEGISTLSGAPLKVTLHPYLVKARASVPELGGDEPVTLVFDDAEHKFALRVSPDQLLSVLRAPVSLAATPREIGGSVDITTPGIRIERGIAVRLLERSGAAAKIALFDREKPRLTGWVPASAIGPSFQSEDDPDRKVFARLVQKPRATIAGEVSLRSKPDGGNEIVNFASLLGSVATDVYELKRRSGAALVVTLHLGWSATGWVSIKDLVEPKRPAARQGKGKGDLVQPVRIERWDGRWEPDGLEGEADDEPGVSLGLTLVAGTPLLASPGGEQVGWATVTRHVSPEETIKDAYRLRLDAPFGELDVWVSQAGLSPPPPPPPPPPPLAVIAPTALEGLRVAGEKIILPDPVDESSMAASGKTKRVATYKVCIDAVGSVSKISMLKSTGLPGYDAKILAAMRAWRYSPYRVDGVAAPVCSSVTFIYVARSDPATEQPASRR